MTVPELVSALGRWKCTACSTPVQRQSLRGQMGSSPSWAATQTPLTLPCTATFQCNHKGFGRTHWGNKLYSVIFCSVISKLISKLCQMSELSYWGIYAIENSYSIVTTSGEKHPKSPLNHFFSYLILIWLYK